MKFEIKFTRQQSLMERVKSIKCKRKCASLCVISETRVSETRPLFLRDIEVLITDRLIDKWLDPAAPRWHRLQADKSSAVDLRPNRQLSRPSGLSSNILNLTIFATAPKRLIMEALSLAHV